MREFKIRAWDEKREKMVTSPNWVEFQVDKNGKLSAKNLLPPHYGKGYQKLTIMQFTGLTTRAGVELYEGDIFTQKRLGKEEIFEIVFRWGMFMAKKGHVEFVLKIACENDHDHGLPIKVIGNKFENLDLIKNYFED